MRVASRAFVPVFALIVSIVSAPHAFGRAIAGTSGDPDSPGGKLFAQRCSACHDHPVGRTPPRLLLTMKDPDAIVHALSSGVMRQQALGLGAEEIASVAEFLTGQAPGQNRFPADANHCPSDARLASPSSEGLRGADLTPANVPRLRLKWAFGLPVGAAGTPVVAAGRVFVATVGGRIYSLDARTGCTYWAYEVGNGIRTVSFGRLGHQAGDGERLFFGDDHANIYALDAQSGVLKWKVQVESHSMAVITTPPVLVGNQVFVAVSGMEDVASEDPAYQCCNFRGSVVALDAANGKQQWKTYMIPEEPSPRPAENGVPRFAPAGGSIYSPFAFNAPKHVLYAATAEAYAEQGVPYANSIVALDMRHGRILWGKELRPRDFDETCKTAITPQCKGHIQLLELASGVAMTRTSKGRPLLLAGQKSGVFYALDPNRSGEVVWESRLSLGADLGGMMYGQVNDGKLAYVPISDTDQYGGRGAGAGGLAAVRIDDGRVMWRTPAPQNQCSWDPPCTSAQASAPTLVDGVIFSGSWDGHMRAYRTSDGAIIWDTSTVGPFQGVNGVEADGGAVSGWAQTVADGALYVVSGAYTMYHPGNALLVYTLDGR